MSDTNIDDLLLKFVSSELNEFGVQQGAISENKQLFTIDQAKSALYELMLSVIDETKDDPEIYWGNGQKIIENRLKEVMK